MLHRSTIGADEDVGIDRVAGPLPQGGASARFTSLLQSRVLGQLLCGRCYLSMQRELREWDFPAVLAARVYAPALDGTAQTVVKVFQIALEVCDHGQVQRRGVRHREFHTQVEPLVAVAFLVDLALDVRVEGVRNLPGSIPLWGIAGTDGFLDAEVGAQVTRRESRLSGR